MILSVGATSPAYSEAANSEEEHRNKEKMVKKQLLIFLLVGTLFGCGAFVDEVKQAIPERRGSIPVISDSFAPRNVRPGTVWKIFIEAQDADGDMQDIVSSIAPATRSVLKYEYTAVKPAEAGLLKGYLFATTPISAELLGEKFDVNIFIRDRAGNKSESIGFTVHFTSEAGGGLPEKWQAVSDNQLGGVFSNYLAQYARRLRFPGR